MRSAPDRLPAPSVRLSSSSQRLEISKITLSTEANVSDISDQALEEIAQDTKKTCVVARALAAVPVTLQLTRLAA